MCRQLASADDIIAPVMMSKPALGGLDLHAPLLGAIRKDYRALLHLRVVS